MLVHDCINVVIMLMYECAFSKLVTRKTWNAKRKTRLAHLAFCRMRCFRYSKHISNVRARCFSNYRQTVRKPGTGNRKAKAWAQVDTLSFVVRFGKCRTERELPLAIMDKNSIYFSQTCVESEWELETIRNRNRRFWSRVKPIPIEKHQLDSCLDKSSTRTISKWEEIKEK